MTANPFYQRDLLSSKDIGLNEINLILSTAQKMKATSFAKSLTDKIIAHCFFEPSTRTRLSFEAAALRLGAQNIGFANKDVLSIQKGETLHDTMRMIDEYADLIVIRHPKEGAAALAAQIAKHPVINAGDGANQHPTQALIDLFTIQECQSRIDGLSMALVGDLKFARTIHSFTQLCSLYDVRLYFVSPSSLSLPDALCDDLKKRGLPFSFHHTLEEIIPKVDILYLTRIQQERFNVGDYEWVNSPFTLTTSLLQKAKSNLKILHPLPRVDEIAREVDHTPFAYYFEQASNGVCVRQALLHLILNKVAL